MGEGLRSQTGGITGLLVTIESHGDALEADLINAGLRLRDCPSDAFDWHDLHIFVKFLDRESILFRDMFPDKAEWTLSNRLLAMIVNCLRLLLWSKTEDGQKGRKRPKMLGPDWADKSPVRAGSDVRPTPISQLKTAKGEQEGRGKKLLKLFR